MWLQHGTALLAYHVYTLLCRGLREPWAPLANPSLCSPFQCRLHSELSQSQGYASGRHRWTSLASLHLRLLLHLELVHQPGSLLWDQAWEKPVAMSFPFLWETTLLSPWEPLLKGGDRPHLWKSIRLSCLPTTGMLWEDVLIGWGKSEYKQIMPLLFLPVKERSPSASQTHCTETVHLRENSSFSPDSSPVNINSSIWVPSSSRSCASANINQLLWCSSSCNAE